eukprot:TRINITY_DN27759_c0_g1_i1.p1 TRINITY_DN27759_c0_g1~~TRINITY_DN27759_c0_g1_i1.p1  ORF type:complete len:157 (-),score=8.76 TRINITY_DN27759_c0_g1_i1:553-1023(-)
MAFRMSQQYRCAGCDRTFSKWGLCKNHLGQSDRCRNVFANAPIESLREICWVEKPDFQHVPDTIDVKVMSFNGNFLTRTTVFWHSSIADLKKEIARATQADPSLQKLVTRKSVMNDSDKVAHFHRLGEPSLTVTMVQVSERSASTQTDKEILHCES